MTSWTGQLEYPDTIGDVGAPPDSTSGPADVQQIEKSIAHMEVTPLGEPPVDFDVRCTYDSRLVNAIDFNVSATSTDSSATGWLVSFVVPNGYRMVPRQWEIQFDNPPSGPAANSTATILQNGVGVPQNSGIIIGAGTSEPIETFFVVEENTTFGATGHNGNLVTSINVSVNVYGNLIPVTDVALPFAIANENKALRKGENVP